MLLKEIKNLYHKELDEIYPKEEVGSFFYLLIEHYLGLERFVLALQPTITISKEEEQPLFEALAQLRLQRPIQYIIGKTQFMGLDFEVDENVLIPRPETEELIRWILEDSQAEPALPAGSRSRSPIVIDIGTGSGCIAVTLAKSLSHAKVFALDVSQKALTVAKSNASKHQVEIEFVQADILKEVLFDEKFDIIVSNPPYVRESEKKEMSANVLGREPASALFVSDEEPLLFYANIARFARKNLSVGGAIYFEINQYLAKETRALLQHLNFLEIELRKDMYGNHRMIKCNN